ncbi:hypothetical protein ACTA71_009419 [Dictyostelium dimigraforme]
MTPFLKSEDIQVLVIDNSFTNRYEELYQERYPTRITTNWNELEKSLASSLNNQLHVMGRTFNYLCTEAPLNPNANRENVSKPFNVLQLCMWLFKLFYHYTSGNLKVGHSFKITVLKREIVRDIKREINLRCFQAKVQTATAAPSSVLKKSYELPDDQVITHVGLSSFMWCNYVPGIPDSMIKELTSPST